MNEEIYSLVLRQPDGLSTDRILAALGAYPQELGDAFEDLKVSGRLLGFAGHWCTPAQYEAQWKRVQAVLDVQHVSDPTRSFQEIDRVFAEANVPIYGKSAARWAEHGVRLRRLRLGEGGIALREFRPKLSEKQATLLDGVERELLAAGLPGVRIEEVADRLHLPPPAVLNIMELGVQSGRLVEVADRMIYPNAVVDHVREEAQREFPAGLTVADLRDMTGTSRRIAFALLEYWDSMGVTDNFEGTREWKKRG
jgi:selenocysteine-specific elongation factor